MLPNSGHSFINNNNNGKIIDLLLYQSPLLTVLHCDDSRHLGIIRYSEFPVNPRGAPKVAMVSSHPATAEVEFVIADIDPRDDGVVTKLGIN